MFKTISNIPNSTKIIVILFLTFTVFVLALIVPQQKKTEPHIGTGNESDVKIKNKSLQIAYIDKQMEMAHLEMRKDFNDCVKDCFDAEKDIAVITFHQCLQRVSCVECVNYCADKYNLDPDLVVDYAREVDNYCFIDNINCNGDEMIDDMARMLWRSDIRIFLVYLFSLLTILFYISWHFYKVYFAKR